MHHFSSVQRSLNKVETEKVINIEKKRTLPAIFKGPQISKQKIFFFVFFIFNVQYALSQNIFFASKLLFCSFLLMLHYIFRTHIKAESSLKYVFLFCMYI